MIQFVCDWCNRTKKPGESWVLGLAAENVAPRAARREVQLLATWDDSRACHALAVHFCSQEHAQNYVATLFETEPPTMEEEVVETRMTTATPQRTTRRVVRTIPSKRGSAKAKSKTSRRRSA